MAVSKAKKASLPELPAQGDIVAPHSVGRLPADGLEERELTNSMKFILGQLGRFWWWVQQGGNSNIILVAITAWYSWLTFRILRWSTAQAREQLRPNLVLTITRSPENLTEGHFVIENVGERDVKILDAFVSCYVQGKRFSGLRPEDVQGAVLPPKRPLSGQFPISPRTDEWVICTFKVVSADVGDQVFRTFEYWSNVHKTIVSGHRSLRVVLRMWMTPIRMPYFRITQWARYSPMRKLLLVALALALLFLLYRVLRS